jgi:geranylgeranyl diphosphate synthase type II
MNQDYNSLLKRFESYLADHQLKGMPESLYAPINYINALGGKRVRPVLLLMSYHLWHNDITPALPAALAVEYFHNFSLIHDDIMDEAELRRGQESVHLRFGRNAAILSGDALLIKCFECLLAAGKANSTGASMCSLMSNAALTICEGQQMDMDFEQMDSPSEQEYMEMIRKKTACLIGTSLSIGAVLAGASANDVSILYEFGENIGLSFQIQDDLLDVFGSSDLTGKQIGGDILRGKKNFMYVRAVNLLPTGQRSDFIDSYSNISSQGNIDEVIQLYKELAIETYAKQIQAEYFNKAEQCLRALTHVNLSVIRSVALDLTSRDH